MKLLSAGSPTPQALAALLTSTSVRSPVMTRDHRAAAPSKAAFWAVVGVWR